MTQAAKTRSVYSMHPSFERMGWGGMTEQYDPDGMVDAMFAGKREALRPLYEKLLRLGLSAGRDVKACPCSTIVPFYRAHVFAMLKPSTLTRIDFGFALGDTKVSGRLIDTGGFQKKDRITHRIPIQTPADIDDEVRHWLRVAYERDAPRARATR